jgi:hypothetical protein
VRAIAGRHSSDEGVHQPPVATAVAATSGGIAGRVGLEGLGRLGEEILDRDRLAIAVQLPAGAEEAGAAVAAATASSGFSNWIRVTAATSTTPPPGRADVLGVPLACAMARRGEASSVVPAADRT